MGVTIMDTWDGDRTYTIAVTDLADELAPTQPYRFKLKRQPNTGQNIFFYKLTPLAPTGDHPFDSGCILLPQEGRELKKRIPVEKRLYPAMSAYLDKLEDLMDEIVEDKVKDDPDGYERLNGFIPTSTQDVNVVTLYRVKHTHQDDTKLMVVVRVNFVDSSPSGSIAVIS